MSRRVLRGRVCSYRIVPGMHGNKQLKTPGRPKQRPMGGSLSSHVRCRGAGRIYILRPTKAVDAVGQLCSFCLAGLCIEQKSCILAWHFTSIRGDQAVTFGLGKLLSAKSRPKQVHPLATALQGRMRTLVGLGSDNTPVYANADDATR